MLAGKDKVGTLMFLIPASPNHFILLFLFFPFLFPRNTTLPPSPAHFPALAHFSSSPFSLYDQSSLAPCLCSCSGIVPFHFLFGSDFICWLSISLSPFHTFFLYFISFLTWFLHPLGCGSFCWSKGNLFFPVHMDHLKVIASLSLSSAKGGDWPTGWRNSHTNMF